MIHPCYVGDSGQIISVEIRRVADGQSLDFASGQFSAAPTTPTINLPAGIGAYAGLYQPPGGSIATPIGMIDASYIYIYHNETKRIAGVTSVLWREWVAVITGDDLISTPEALATALYGIIRGKPIPVTITPQ